MQTPGLVIMLSVLLFGPLQAGLFGGPVDRLPTAQNSPAAAAGRQLLAVRGEVVKKKAMSKGWLQLTVKPPRDYPEVAVMARENDVVGNAANRSKDADIVGLLADREGDSEAITAVEIEEGDFISVIYDPQAQNRALEIYLH